LFIAELQENSVIRKIRVTAVDGKLYNTKNKSYFASCL